MDRGSFPNIEINPIVGSSEESIALDDSFLASTGYIPLAGLLSNTTPISLLQLTYTTNQQIIHHDNNKMCISLI